MTDVKVKKESTDVVDIENRIKELCQQFPQGITDQVIQNDMPHVEAQQRAMAINRLLSVGQLDLLRNSNGLLYRLKDNLSASKMKGSDNQEKLVYQIIEDAGNKGIWSREIRYKSNLPLTEINKILKNLESKKLIKAVKSVAASKKKVYMLYNLQPDRSVTGGAWYSDQDFESEFVEVLNQQCFKFLQSKVDLSMEDIETILNTLIYDGKVEMTIIAAKEGTVGCVDGQMKLYRGVNAIIQPTGLVKTPCGLCPVFDDCHEGEILLRRCRGLRHEEKSVTAEMKFVAVVAGAGAVAFLGALVCIVASVYSRAPAAALQPPAAANGTASPVPSGSLGALYGADTSERKTLTGAGTGRETPLLGELSAGGSPQRFTFSRLLCSPVPPGECAMKRRRRDKEVEQQAEYDEEDWSALSTTAEELRRTVALQSEQIAADRKTIVELTGKLAECESALLDERTVTERGAATSWPARRRLMAGDGVRESAAAQLHTARAVEELERAILQLKDRIEKLELEMVPALLNHSEVAAGSTGMRLALGQPGGRVEDVGGELVQKVKQLEEERKNLRKETQNHHQHIDQGISTLQERVSELEQSFTGQSFPQGYKLSFPMRTNYMYGLVRRNVPEMYAFTACVWLKATESGIGTPFSYAVDKQPNELVLLQGVHNPAELLINAKVAQLPLMFPPGTWQHVCVSWTLRDGVWKAYQGGKLKGRGEGLSAWHPIRAGGVLVLGQEQDTPGGQFDASQALVGELSLFNLWDRVLSPAEISTLAACGVPVLLGNVVSWTDRDVDVFGGATKEPLGPCSSDSGPQK
ncbi:hypothetical protein QTP70_023798 [Hemibagrus guttatus]|uniref:DNA-directed RNA polymerase III subunit RPC6 n=1 Tax=Hemibagrus guttatus TaxID=175788 RepID=A0AAE0PXT8_9TELE|nr:hypothetical protein QTP70_023798 [Hemibagrus guttatus]